MDGAEDGADNFLKPLLGFIFNQPKCHYTLVDGNDISQSL